MHLSDFPQDVITQYELTKLANKDGMVFVKIQKGMYGLPQAGLLEQELLEQRLNKHGYRQSKLVPGLWKHDTRPIQFTLVVDDFGSAKLDKLDEEKMSKAGIFLKRFQPYASIGDFYFGRRMHHKVFVFDECLAIVAGMNVADRYRGTIGKEAWLDYGILVEGPICVQLAEFCTEVLERKFAPGRLKLPSKWIKALVNAQIGFFAVVTAYQH